MDGSGMTSAREAWAGTFAPAWWARGPHAQTLLARVLRRGALDMERERLETPDGDFIDVDWGPEPRPDAPLAIVLHGLEGSSRRGYVQSACRALFDAGIRPLAMNFRGCSGEPNRTLRSYHSGDTSDVAWLTGVVRDRYPGRPVGGIGFSLGGNVLLKLLGEREDRGVGLLDGAVAMSVPFDLAAGSAFLERSRMGRAYAAYFMRSLRRKIDAKRDRLREILDLDAAQAARTIREFDERVTAPLNDFRDAADYYERCSSVRFLGDIRVPTLLLHAVDDPFLPPDAIPIETVRANPSLELQLVATGGHVGFLEGSPWAPRFWADTAAARFLANELQASARSLK